MRARLDRDGNLHSVEQHAIVFDGDWNGGARRFNVALGQDFHLEKIERIDLRTGARTPLREGDLSKVDHYGWVKGTLQWRSRLPSDPPFSNTTILYEIDSTVSNVLIPEGDTYRLDHAFAFPDRDGVIEHFTLTLDLDPQFEPLIATPLHWEVRNIAPGQTFGVRLPLRYLGAGEPASVHRGAPPIGRAAVVLIMLIAAAAVSKAFYLREKERGSFDPLPAVAVDEAWLAANLFSMPPEVAGAAWDSSTGSAEVAALIARLIQEGKLSSRIERDGTVSKRDVLHLKLLADATQLHGYEKNLISALFFDGRTEVSSEEVQAHYKTSGFDPASKIRGGVEKQIRQSLGQGKKKPRQVTGPVFSIPVIAVLFVAAVTLLVLSAVADLSTLPAVILFAVAGCFFGLVPSLFLSAKFAKTASNRSWSIVVAVWPLLVLGIVICAFTLGGLERGMPLMLFPMMTFTHPGLLLLLGLAALFVAFLTVVLRIAMSSETPESLALRRKLVTAREFFRQQLELQNPKLRDEWYPYLLAFGLGANVDHWFRSYGGSAVSGIAGSSLSSHSLSTGSSWSSSWSGGGGAFGGAGGSGAWAAAAGSMAAGIASASSSGGGGGGGGFSSGGGGGGGW